jgi:hypothetical protein
MAEELTLPKTRRAFILALLTASGVTEMMIRFELA